MHETVHLARGAPRSRRLASAGTVICALLVALALVACSGDDAGSGDDVSGTSAEASASDAPAGSGAVASADENLERASLGGVTFTYDTTVIESVEPAEPGNEDDGTAPEGAPTTALVLTLVDGGEGTLVVTEPSEDGPTGNLTDDDGLSFVNGTGTRTSDATSDPAYRFAGQTADLLAAVEVTARPAGLAHDDVTAAFDELIGSLFVDTAGAGEAECDDDFEFVEHVTIPDGTVVEPGAELTKTWRIRNVGDCEWDERWSWTFTGGDPLTILDTTSLAGTGPGEEVDVSVRLRVPDEAGVWSAQWQPMGPDSRLPVGSPIIIFVETAT